MSLSSKGLVYEAVSADAVAGVQTLNLPANTFGLLTSNILSVVHTTAPVAGAVAYVRSVAIGENTGLATLTLNSTDATYVGKFKVCWNTPASQ